MADPTLDLALRDLGAHIAWPPEVDLASQVGPEIENVAPLRPRRRARRVALLAAAALLVVTGLLTVSPGLRAAVLEFLGIRGAMVEVHESVSPPSGPSFAGQALLGEHVTPQEAERELGFDLSLPRALGRGEGVFLLREGASTIATVAYREGELILSQFAGRLEQETIGKAVTVEQAERVRVGDAPGIWVEGAHTVFVRDPSGAIVESRALLGGNTLLWTLDGVTFRLEGAARLDEALRIARTVAL
jgi:hypothetical protein